MPTRNVWTPDWESEIFSQGKPNIPSQEGRMVSWLGVVPDPGIRLSRNDSHTEVGKANVA